MSEKTKCPECQWGMTTDEDGIYCERCDGENDPLTSKEATQ